LDYPPPPMSLQSLGKGQGTENMRIQNIFGNRYKGALGKDMIAASWKGHDYIKRYAAPTNPRSEQQTKHRAIFGQAVQAWKKLTARQKEFYNKIADGMSGFNVFVGRYVHAVRNSYEPETPVPMSWTTADRNPVIDGWLIIRQHSRQIFVDRLSDCKGEIALTPSDAPYEFVLKKGAKEDIVLTMEDVSTTGTSVMLESALLGIKLIASTPDRRPASAPSTPTSSTGIEDVNASGQGCPPRDPPLVRNAATITPR